MIDFPKILVVDDSIYNIKFLKALFKKVKCTTIHANSGTEAIEIVNNNEIALAIIDVKMPLMNGYELAVKINMVRNEKIPIIFLTASHYDKVEVMKGYGLGAVDYLYKPIDNYILLSKVDVFLNLYNQKQIIIENSRQIKLYSEELSKTYNELIKSEHKYRSYIDNAPDGVFIFNKDGFFTDANPALNKISGYSNEELAKMKLNELFINVSLENFLNNNYNVHGKQSSNNDISYKNKIGTLGWIVLEVVKLSDNEFLGFAKDINERKQKEEEIINSLEKLHQLSKHVEKVREKERLAISRELHDDLGQALTAVKIDLTMIKNNIENDNKTVEKINKVINLVGNTIKTVQKLTSQLRPEVLEDLGIEAAIEWYTKEFSERTHIDVNIDIVDKIIISSDDALIVFRILQESLTNISRHTKATKVEIKLFNSHDCFCLSVIDNGIGITENSLNSKKSFGIIGMMERAASLGGNFNIYNNNGKGTIAKLIFPIKKQITQNENTNL